MKQRILIQGSLTVAGVAAAVVLRTWVFPQWTSQGWEETTDILGIVLVFKGFLIRIMARGYKKQKSEQSHALVTSGIYRLTRNPMYFGTMLIGLGAIIAMFHWWLIFVFLAAFLAIYLPEMRKEEVWLTEHFGEVYECYCRGTPKFFPRLSGVFESRFWREFGWEWSWIWPELRAMVITVGVIGAIEVWQDQQLFASHQWYVEAGEFLLIAVVVWVIWFGMVAVVKKIQAP